MPPRKAIQTLTYVHNMRPSLHQAFDESIVEIPDFPPDIFTKMIEVEDWLSDSVSELEITSILSSLHQHLGWVTDALTFTNMKLRRERQTHGRIVADKEKEAFERLTSQTTKGDTKRPTKAQVQAEIQATVENQRLIILETLLDHLLDLRKSIHLKKETLTELLIEYRSIRKDKDQ